MKPTPEQFEEWRANPITEWLFDTFVPAEMARTKKRFEELAWDGGLGQAYTEFHRVHRERFDTLEWLRGLDMETIEQTLEMQE